MRIRCEHDVAVTRHCYDRSVDGIPRSAHTEQASGSPTQLVVERRNVDAGEQPCEQYLSAGTAPPHLSDDAAMASGWPASETFCFDECDDVAITALRGDERSGVEDQRHAAPRETTALDAARRWAEVISSALISPCSAS